MDAHIKYKHKNNVIISNFIITIQLTKAQPFNFSLCPCTFNIIMKIISFFSTNRKLENSAHDNKKYL